MSSSKHLTNAIKHCPVHVSMSMLGRKWTIHIIRDMLRGMCRFSDFLVLNPKLTTKVLSQRLKELTTYGLIEKVILGETPIRIEYHLTDKGLALNQTIIELSKFSITKYPEKVFAKVGMSDEQISLAISEAENRFSVISSVEDYT